MFIIKIGSDVEEAFWQFVLNTLKLLRLPIFFHITPLPPVKINWLNKDIFQNMGFIPCVLAGHSHLSP